MTKSIFNQKKLEELIKGIFPNSKIQKNEKFNDGLVSSVFKVNISNPDKILVVKLGRLKNKETIHKGNQIIQFLKDEKILVPEVLFEGVMDRKYVTVMTYCQGDVASSIYSKSSQKIKQQILINAGRELKRIHSLKVPAIWNNKKYNIQNMRQWQNWTKQRIDKYLKFIKNKWPDDYEYIKNELDNFYQILKKEKFNLSSLHWDYHLANINIEKNGKITGIFDFEQTLKGHNLADIGISAYFLRFFVKDKTNLPYFLKGYQNKFTNKEINLIRGYFLMHILAVSRSIWFKKNLRWIIDEHRIMINEFKNTN